MRFSQQLRRDAEEWFQRIYEHPFVQGIKKGYLKPEQLLHYVVNDHQYLNAFAKIYALALSRSKTRERMQFFHEQIHFILHGETHPHRTLCRLAGVDYDRVEMTKPLAPSARNYMNHMWVAAQTGTFADLYAALLPCPWTYIYIAQRMMEEEQPSPEHPFYDWITFYTTEHIIDLNRALCEQLDEEVQSLSASARKRARENFMISCDHEYRFWEMAYTLEEYPFVRRGRERDD